MAQCKQCGAYISAHAPKCPYCGTPNLEYQPPVDEINYWLVEGLAAFHQGRYANAIENYRRALDRAPDILACFYKSLRILGSEKAARAHKR